MKKFLRCADEKIVPGKIAAAKSVRVDTTKISLLATLGDNLKGTVVWIGTRGSAFDPHFVIDVDGKIVQTFPLDLESSIEASAVTIALVSVGRLVISTEGWIARFSGKKIESTDLLLDGEDAWQIAPPLQIAALLVLLAEIRSEIGNVPVSTIGGSFWLGKSIAECDAFSAFHK